MFARASVLLAAGAALLAAAPAAARSWAGGVDMAAACHEQYGENYMTTHSSILGDSWYCYTTDGAYGSIDVSAYCATTYGGGAYADPQGGGAFDWGCYYP